MGGTNSVEIDQDLLNSLRYSDPETVATRIKSTLQIKTEAQLLEFVTLILNATDNDEAWMSVRYAKLARSFVELDVYDPRKGQVTFKEALTQRLRVHLWTSNEIPARFLAELFNNGMFSATMTLYWLKLIDMTGRSRFLTEIRDKVARELNNPEREGAIDTLKEWIRIYGVEKTAAKQPHQETTAAQNPVEPASNRSFPYSSTTSSGVVHPAIPTASSNPVSSVSDLLDVVRNVRPAPRPVYESSSSDDEQQNPSGYAYEEEDYDYSSYDEEASQNDYSEDQSESSYGQSESGPAAFPDLFRAFLEGLEKNSKLGFRVRRFKICSEADRKECAQILLDAIISRPKIIVPATIVIKNIQANPPNNQLHPKFMDILRDLIETKVRHVLKQSSKWTPLRNIGKFLAILNSKNAITNATMNVWLDGVQPFVSKNNHSALNALLEILKITLNQMKTKDVRKFNFYVLEVERISKSGRYIHPSFVPWMEKVIKNNLKAAQPAIPPNRGAQSQKPTPTATIPTRFQKFLADLIQNPSTTYDLAFLKTCSEADRRHCAQLTLEFVVANAGVIEPLAFVMHKIQCTLTPKNVDHCKFSDHLSVLIESKINQLVAQESKWNPLEVIGNFLSEMYILECIRNETMNKWLDALQPFVDNTNVKGTNVYISVLKSCAEKLRIKNPTRFKFHLQRLENLQPTVWLSPELQEWKRIFLKTHGNKNVLTNNNVASVQQKTTGAIKKTTNIPTVVDPLIISPASSSKSLSAAIKKNPYPASTSTIMMVQQKLNKMYSDHDAFKILEKIVALNIEMSANNLRKITNMMTSNVVSRPDIIASSVTILANLPRRSIPPFDPIELKNQLMLSIWDQVFHFQTKTYLIDTYLVELLKFITQLHSKHVLVIEDIIFIVEKLAVSARNDENFPLIMLMRFLETYSACHNPNPNLLKETKVTLHHHHSHSKSQSVVKSVEEALKLLTPTTEVQKPKPEDPQCLPSTSAASTIPDNKKTFLDILEELPTKGMVAVKAIANQIKSPMSCDEFAAACYEATMKTGQYSLYAEVAQAVEKELASTSFAGTISKAVIQFLYSSYLPKTQQQLRTSRDAKNRLKFIGELYKIKWVTIEELTIVLEELSETELLVQLFQAFLSIVALSVVQNGHGEKLIKYRTIYAERQDGYMDSMSDYLACQRIVRMLDAFSTLSAGSKQKDFNLEAVKTMIDDLNLNNIEEQTKKIKSMSDGAEADLEIIANEVLVKLGESEDHQLLSSFVCVLQEVFKESKDKLNAIFTKKCQKVLSLELNRGGEETNSNRSFSLIMFFAQLYLADVLNSDFIAQCSEVVISSKRENKNYLYMLLFRIGAKLDAQDHNTLEMIFEKLENLVAEEATKPYQADDLRNLIKIRANGWETTDTANLSRFSLVLLESLTRSNSISMSSGLEIVKLCEKNPEELVISFYFSVIRSPDNADLYADLCEIIHKHLTAFKNLLNKCLRSRMVSVVDLRNRELDDETQSDLAAAIIFAGELYVRDLIDDDTLAILLKPAKRLRFDAISQLVSVVGEKVSGGDSIRLKAQLMNLEEVVQDDTKKFWEDLKRDINEISEAVSNSNGISSYEAASEQS